MVKILPKSTQELKRHEIRTLLKAGVAMNEICEVVRTSLKTVRSVRKSIRTNGSVRRKPGSKGIQKLPESVKIAIHKLLSQNLFMSAQEIVRLFDLLVTLLTIHNQLKKAGFTHRCPYKKLAFTEGHIRRWLKWCREMETFMNFNFFVPSDEACF